MQSIQLCLLQQSADAILQFLGNDAESLVLQQASGQV
jgi:hypothetical protein